MSAILSLSGTGSGARMLEHPSWMNRAQDAQSCALVRDLHAIARIEALLSVRTSLKDDWRRVGAIPSPAPPLNPRSCDYP
ncbi:MAG: hypothetical protein ACK4HW_13270 [Roseinatronobacter sp.]